MKMDKVGEFRDRLMPQNLEAEQAALGSALIDQDAVSHLLTLEEDDFYREAHRHVFVAMKTLAGQSKEIDLITLYDELRRVERIDDVGGSTYLTQLIDSVPAASNVERYVEMVREKAEYRKMILLADTLAGKCYEQSESPSLIRGSAIDQLLGQNRTRKDDVQRVGEIIGTVFNDHAAPKSAVPFCIPTLSEVLPGWLPGRYYVVAGRPGAGKTALSVQMAEHAAKQGFPSGFITLEMPKEQLAMRFVTALTAIPERALWSNDHDSSFWAKLADAGDKLSSVPAYVVSPDHTLDSVLLAMRTMVAKYNVKIIFVDYLQLVDPGPRHSTEYQQVSAVSRALNRSKATLGIPIIALSQFSRGGDKADRPPRLSDLRGSGVIEENADTVIFLHEYESDEPQDGYKDVAMKVAKNRNGPLALTSLMMVKNTMTFSDEQCEPRTLKW